MMGRRLIGAPDIPYDDIPGLMADGGCYFCAGTASQDCTTFDSPLDAPDRCTSSLLNGENPRFHRNCIAPERYDSGSGEHSVWQRPIRENATDFRTLTNSSEWALPPWCNCTSAEFTLLARGSPLCELEAAALGTLYVDLPPAKALLTDSDGILRSTFTIVDQVGTRRTTADTWSDYYGWRVPIISSASALVDQRALGGLSGVVNDKGGLGSVKNITQADELLSPRGLVGALPRGLVRGTPGGDLHLTPAYRLHVDDTLDSISSQVLANQIRLRDNEAIPQPVEPLGLNTVSLALEQLFPSATIEVIALNETTLSSSISITSFWGDQTDWPYVRTPTTWADDDALKQFSLAKFREGPAAARLSMSGGIGSLLQNWWVNAMARSGLHPNATISVAFKPFPYERSAAELLRNDGGDDSGDEVLSLLIDVTVPLATTFVLPLVVSTVVLEKEHKLRALMVMMGLRMRWYWLTEWMWSSFLVLLINIVLLIAGVVSNLTFIARSTQLVGILLLLWSACTVACGMLISTLHSRLLVASVSTYLLIVILILFSVILNQVVLSGTADQFPTALFLIAPIAYYRGIHLLAARPYTLAAMSPELRTIFVMLVVDTLVYAVLSVYLDAVLPREFGVTQPPLFFLQPVKNLMSRTLDKHGHPQPSTSAKGLVSDSSGRSDEDVDVVTERLSVEKRVALRKMHERAAAERGTRSNASQHQPPIEMISMRKVYPGGKVAVRDLTLAIHENECFGLLGPNGAGKTSTIAMLTGLYPPTSGETNICGFDLGTQMHRIHEAMGVCPQFDVCPARTQTPVVATQRL